MPGRQEVVLARRNCVKKKVPLSHRVSARRGQGPGTQGPGVPLDKDQRAETREGRVGLRRQRQKNIGQDIAISWPLQVKRWCTCVVSGADISGTCLSLCRSEHSENRV